MNSQPNVVPYSEPDSGTNFLGWINFLLIFAVIVYIIVATIVFHNQQNDQNTIGIPLNIVQGVTSGSTDNYTLTGQSIYIAQSSLTTADTGFVLTVTSSNSQVAGQVTYIKNTTSGSISIQGGSGTSLIASGLTNNVAGGQTAAYMSTDGSSKWMRLF